jgi:hypothetical protein
MSAVLQDLAPFRSVNEALAFAFNFKHGQLEPSVMAMIMGGPRHSSRGLGGLDGAAQAGMVRAEVCALKPAIRCWILTARFAVRELPCHCGAMCCSGFKPNTEWVLAVMDTAELVRTTALAGMAVNFTLRHTLVRRYFGVKKSLLAAAQAADVDRDTASAHASRVIAYLREEERHARYEIEARLKQNGCVE